MLRRRGGHNERSEACTVSGGSTCRLTSIGIVHLANRSTLSTTLRILLGVLFWELRSSYNGRVLGCYSGERHLRHTRVFRPVRMSPRLLQAVHAVVHHLQCANSSWCHTSIFNSVPDFLPSIRHGEG